jgi:anhydro-N-acetylmuramic acid kinase
MTAQHTERDSTVVVGLMSGTSLDGVTAVVVRFERHDAMPKLSADLLSFVQRPFSTDERARIERAMGQGSAQEYCRLHVDMGHWLADAAIQALAETDVPRSEVACIASHGQTLWHEPGHSTWQTGDPATIAERTGCTVVADFRARDVAAGGQGAPLVPMADALLFAHATEWRALQNIGGIGNVTVVPPHDTLERQLDGVRAFDTGPGVILIDALTRQLRPDLPYDVDGAMAQRGSPFVTVVDEALAHPYFRLMPPKSTGRELFSRSYADVFMSACRERGASDDDVVATATMFTARAIADQYAQFMPEPVSEVVLSGGGAKNPTLVEMIRTALSAHASSRNMRAPRVALFDDCFFDGEAKEAVAFALLGYLTLRGESGNVPKATGAREPRTLGVMVPS